MEVNMAHPNNSFGRDMCRTRKFKKFCRKGAGPTGPVEDAYIWGLFAKSRPNPFPKGARNLAFAYGQKVTLNEYLND